MADKLTSAVAVKMTDALHADGCASAKGRRCNCAEVLTALAPPADLYGLRLAAITACCIAVFHFGDYSCLVACMSGLLFYPHQCQHAARQSLPSCCAGLGLLINRVLNWKVFCHG